MKDWIDELRNYGPRDIVTLIVGNKLDLEDQREVSTELAGSYAREIGALFIETSSKTDRNVSKAFISLSTRLKLEYDDVMIDADDGRGTHMRYFHNNDQEASRRGCSC